MSRHPHDHGRNGQKQPHKETPLAGPTCREPREGREEEEEEEEKEEEEEEEEEVEEDEGAVQSESESVVRD